MLKPMRTMTSMSKMMHALTGSPKMKRAHTRNDARTTGSPKMKHLLTGMP